MISSSSAFASSMPATSAKVTLGPLSSSRRAPDLPKRVARPPPACVCRTKKTKNPTIRRIGSHASRISSQALGSTLGRARMATPRS